MDPGFLSGQEHQGNGAIDIVAPYTAIHLCVFHVLQALKKKLNTEVCGQEQLAEVLKLQYKVVYASTQDRLMITCDSCGVSRTWYVS